MGAGRGVAPPQPPHFNHWLNVVICYVEQEFHKHQTLNTVQCLLHIVYNNQTHVVYR